MFASSALANVLLMFTYQMRLSFIITLYLKLLKVVKFSCLFLKVGSTSFSLAVLDTSTSLKHSLTSNQTLLMTSVALAFSITASHVFMFYYYTIREKLWDCFGTVNKKKTRTVSFLEVEGGAQKTLNYSHFSKVMPSTH